MKLAAKEKLRARVDQWSSRLRVRPSQIRIQAMTRKWGSCSSSGRVTFSSDLVGRPVAFQDFVIVHELLHLRIRNHGKLFHSILHTHLRDNKWAAPTNNVNTSAGAGFWPKRRHKPHQC